MDTLNDFEVIIKRNIPYFFKFTYWTLGIICVLLFLLLIPFIPTRHQSLEMKTVYFILVYPKSLQYLTVYLSISFVAFLILNSLAKRHNAAVLTFLPEKIQIIGKKIDRTIAIADIVKVYCMDAQTSSGESREKLTIYIEDKNKVETAIRLKFYLQADDFMDKLMNYQNLNFEAFNFDISPNTLNEN